MTYRVQYLHNRQWLSVGLDCLNRGEVAVALAMAPTGAQVRVKIVGRL